MIAPPGLDTLLLLPEPARIAVLVERDCQAAPLPGFLGAEVRRCHRLDPSGATLDAAIALDPTAEDLELFLRAARERVRKGGAVVVRLPNPGFWPSLASWLCRAVGKRNSGTGLRPAAVRAGLARAGFGRARNFFWFETRRYPCVLLPPGRPAMRRCLARLCRQGPGLKQDVIRFIVTIAPARLLASHYLLVAPRM